MAQQHRGRPPGLKSLARFGLTVMTAGMMLALTAGVASATAYQDVPARSQYATEIASLSDRGIISGYSDGTFRPGQPVTRGQFAKMVVGAVGAHTESPTYPNEGAQPTFTDVPFGHTFFDFVEEGDWQGIIRGYPDGTFKASQALTRAQLALMVVRAGGADLAPGAAPPPFGDVANLSAEAREAIAVAYSNGIISGHTDGTFRPGEPATRGHVAKMVYQLSLKLKPPLPAVPDDPAGVDHTNLITEYEGPKTCEGCHPGVTEDVAYSLHFTMEEEEVPGFQGMQGRY